MPLMYIDTAVTSLPLAKRQNGITLHYQHAPWKTAETIQDLCVLQINYLRGMFREGPFTTGRFKEKYEGMKADLIALNFLGICTDSCQDIEYQVSGFFISEGEEHSKLLIAVEKKGIMRLLQKVLKSRIKAEVWHVQSNIKQNKPGGVQRFLDKVTADFLKGSAVVQSEQLYYITVSTHNGKADYKLAKKLYQAAVKCGFQRRVPLNLHSTTMQM